MAHGETVRVPRSSNRDSGLTLWSELLGSHERGQHVSGLSLQRHSRAREKEVCTIVQGIGGYRPGGENFAPVEVALQLFHLR